MLLLGYPGAEQVGLPVDDVVNGDVTIIGSFAYTRDAWREVVELLNSGALDLGGLVDAPLPAVGLRGSGRRHSGTAADRAGRSCWKSPSSSLEGLRKVGPDVVYGLEPDAQTQKTRRHAVALHRARASNVDATPPRLVAFSINFNDRSTEVARSASATSNKSSGPKRSDVASGHRVAESGIPNLLHQRMLGKPARDLQSAGRLALHPDRDRLEASHQQPDRIRRGDDAEAFRKAARRAVASGSEQMTTPSSAS